MSRHLDDPYLPGTQWTYGDVVLALVAGVAAATLVGVAIQSAPWRAEDAGVGMFELATTLLAQAAGSLAVVVTVARGRDHRQWWRDVGLSFRARDAWGLLGGVALQLVVALLVGPLIRLIEPDAPRQQVVDIAEETAGGVGTVVFALLVVAVAPLVEEVIFRGMLLSRLRVSMGPVAAVTVSAAGFAALHVVLDPNALAAAPGLFLIGVVLGRVALRTGDIGLAVTIHAGVNLTGVLVLLVA